MWQMGQVEFDNLAVVQRAIPLTLDEREVDKDAARCLWRVGDSPALFVVPASHNCVRHKRIVGSGARAEAWASVPE